MQNMAKILAISAHSDDVEFYAGGALLKLARNNELVVVVATDGRNGTHDKAMVKKLALNRKAEQELAVKFLGAKRVISLSYPDGQLENNRVKLKVDLLRVFVSEKPDMVFSFDPERQHMVHNDIHPDHRTLALAVLDVLFIDATLPSLVRDPLPRPKLFLFNASRPNRNIDVTTYFDQKLKLLRLFKSQNLELPKKNKSGQYFEKFYEF